MLCLALGLGFAEAVLRVKNLSMQNYDIEMWRYARELKKRSDDPFLGHEHIPNSDALLQSVGIRINEHGLRGAPIEPLAPGQRRILFLGGSITLGWGVPEEQVLTSLIQQKFAADGKQVQVLNAGIGNYNAERYTELFFKRLEDLKPTDIVVHYFLRDAEKLDAGGGNFLLRNSELAVTAWIAMNRLFGPSGPTVLEDHYKQVYNPEEPGYKAMRASLQKLADDAKANNIRLTPADTQDHVTYYAGCDAAIGGASYFQSSSFNANDYYIQINDNNFGSNGTVYSPYGYTKLTANNIAITASLIADSVGITGNNIDLRYGGDYTPRPAASAGISSYSAQ